MKAAVITLLFVIGFGILFFFIQNQQPATKSNDDLTLEYNQDNGLLTTPPNTKTDIMGQQDVKQETKQNAIPTPGVTTDPASLPTTAVIETSKGTITLELYPDAAPLTVKNFADKAKSGFYKNLTFHRVENWVLQGGDPLGNGTGGGNMPTEFNDKPYKIGSVGVARRNDPKVQNDAQFFITKQDASWLDGQYTNFGFVTEGMNIVNQMEIGDKILSISVE
jgi:peptidyl-prolyl cis-trans isomerase B (cyclophilin B)